MLRTTGSVAENLQRIQASVADAAVQAGRRPEEITLVAVSKSQPAEAVVEAIAAGARIFGENRVQEAAEKLPAIERLLASGMSLRASSAGGHDPAGPVGGAEAVARGAGRADPSAAVSGGVDQASAARGLRWHMIGHLQTNKVGVAVGLFDSIDSVDSLHLAQALSRRVVAGGGPDLAIRLEVYVGDDPRRPGVRPAQLVEVAGQILELPGLRVEGLMTVAPLGGDARAAFSQVRELKLKLSQSYPAVHFGVLSMGMSEDYIVAIQAGSTEIRLGTAVFGPRQPRY